ncbi:lytic transglycosylase domain-containing protein [Comamonas sp. Tr-654]|uniref:lytic transglycosylase domain-containing protein n=1 Tax=Comamonas sp. Tr-654 TaxID=2608341 RepID=UPI001422EDB5|nr:lytic transglycosylase domain-containing protein [Comamonas sp. Tr-654]NIF86068.1 lytic transglycosylase domain-containing protein [Comamonas sp. Tr-654]
MLLLAGSLAAEAADVYVAFDESGTAHFSDRALDGSYQLLLQDLSEPSPQRLASPVLQRGPADEIRSELESAANRHGLEYALLHAVAQTESRFDPKAVSPKGAIGVMQLMPSTAQRYGVHAPDAETLRSKLHKLSVNIDVGGRLLSDLMRRFNGQTELALAAYNAGEGAVRRAGNQIPNYPETRQYVEKVMKTFRALRTKSAHIDGKTARNARLPETSGVPESPHVGRSQSVQLFRGEAVEFKKFEQGFDVFVQ